MSSESGWRLSALLLMTWEIKGLSLRIAIRCFKSRKIYVDESGSTENSCCFIHPYVFKQDRLPAHTTKITQDWLKTNLKDSCPKEIWPPRSLECNPLDYFMWSLVGREVNKNPHNTLASLSMQRSWLSWPKLTGRSSSLLAWMSSLGLRLLWRPMRIS